MPITQKYKKFALHKDKEEYQLPKYRERGEPIRTIGEVHIDRTCWAKSKKEKQILKALRLDCKRDAMKKR